MRIQPRGQAEELLGKSELVIITERVDDVEWGCETLALLIVQMVKMGLSEVLARHIPRRWNQRGISWGWTAVMWLADILTGGDHRKVSVASPCLPNRPSRGRRPRAPLGRWPHPS